MLKRLLVIFLPIIFVTSCDINNTKADVSHSMQSMLRNLELLIPYLFDLDRFSDDENREMISNSIKEMDDNFSMVSSHLSVQSKAAQISANVMKLKLDEAKTAYDKKQDTQALYLLSTLPSACASCHIQDGKAKQLFSSLSKNDFVNDYGFAEFNFVTRQYKRALKYYDAYIEKDDPNTTDLNVLNALERELIIHLSIYRDVDAAGKLIRKRQAQRDFNTYTRNIVNQWEVSLTQINTERLLNEKLSLATIEKYVQTNFFDGGKYIHPFFVGEDQRLPAMVLRARLHRLLSEPENKSTPQALYWLSILERLLSEEDTYSYADLYLKDCITSYSDLPIAKQCYDEYASSVLFYYSGSSGTHIPDALQSELRALKKKVSQHL